MWFPLSSWCRRKFLGHAVSAAAVEVDVEKAKAVLSFPVPRNIKELQHTKGAKLNWTTDCQAAFDALKHNQIFLLLLGHPTFDLPFIVYPNASGVGLGVVLVQQTGLGAEQVLAFASRTFNQAE